MAGYSSEALLVWTRSARSYRPAFSPASAPQRPRPRLAPTQDHAYRPKWSRPRPAPPRLGRPEDPEWRLPSPWRR